MSDTKSQTTANGVLAVLLNGTADSDGGGKQANPGGADFQLHITWNCWCFCNKLPHFTTQNVK